MASFRTLAITLLLGACTPMNTTNDPPEVHGHRGCRGLLPENTVPAFLRATELGCDRLEMDVVVTGDGQVLVSHEPWLEHRICLDPDGRPITAATERSFNLYRMTVAEVQRCDCGSLGHPDHADQEAMRAVKPTLAQVVEAVEEHALMNGLHTPGYNIEIKSDPALYGTFQPPPEELARLVLDALDGLGITDLSIVQSFDPAVLEAVHAIEPDVVLALLVEDAAGLETQLSRLSFTPSIYSPYHALVDRALVDALAARDIRLVVWTVNEEEDIRRMLSLGVDGIISDHPERVLRLIEQE
jgi:glycerophosphoryl diester phosphodiesterase